MKKKCSKCHNIKSIDEFYSNKKTKKVASRCNACSCEDKREWRKENLKKVRKLNADYRKENREKINANRRMKRDAYRETERIYWNKPENKTRKRENYKRWAKENICSLRKNKNTYDKERRKKDLAYKLSQYLRSRLQSALKTNQKSGSFVKDLGCSIDELKCHLESKFKPSMTWENYGEWHIDHKMPLAKFNLANRKEFLQACHYTNLQPLWAVDNLRKGKKYA